MVESAALTLRLLERVRDVSREAWDAIVDPDGTPFVEHTWLDCLEEAGCVGERVGWLPRHFALYRGDALVAVAPVYVRGGSEGEFVFDFAWADLAARMGKPYYPKLLFGVPFTPATGGRVLAAPGEDVAEVTRLFAIAARQIADDADLSSVHVNFIREDEQARWIEHGYFPRFHFQYQWFRNGASSFDEYLSRFNSKRRNQIKRECAQAGRDGLTVETLAPKDITRKVVRRMYELYASTVDKHYWGSRYLNVRFFELVADRFADRLAWVVARDSSGDIVAGAFNVTKGKRLYGRYWGTRIEQPMLHFHVCYYHGVRECLERGLDVFEPGAGGEHKRARGFVPTLTYSAHWLRDRRLASIIEPHVARERERVMQIVASGEDS
jgi:predicted N-acyltransferase